MKAKYIKLLKSTVTLLLSLTLLMSVTTVYAEDTYLTYKKAKEGGLTIAQGYNYLKPVPKNAAVDLKYFNDAVLLGDSRTVGLHLSTNLSKTKILPCCDIGLNVNTVKEKAFVNIGSQKYTALEAMKKKKKSWSKVYLMFGLNELAFPSVESFIKSYSSLIDEIRKINKDAIIYVQCILPVSRKKDHTDKAFNNLNAQKNNTYIKEMCISKKVFYLDLYSQFCGADGYLPEFTTGDGIHLQPAVAKNWLKYLQTHTVDFKKSK